MKVIGVLVVTIAAIAAEDCSVNWPPEQLMPHDTECDKYYQCVRGNRVKMVCPSNLYFNDNTLQCDWPYNVQCGDRNPPGQTNKPGCNNSTTTTTPEPTTLPPCNTTSTDPPTTTTPLPDVGDCLSTWPPEQLIPHDTDCSKYYQCAWGKLVEMQCPSGLLFNNQTGQCDWEANVQCGDRDTSGQTTTTPGGNNTTTTPPPCNTTTTATTPPPSATNATLSPTVPSPTPSTAPPCNTDPAPTTTWQPIPTTAITPPPDGFLPNGCPKDPTVHWLLPVSGCCNSFYQCVWGNTVHRNCPPTLHFNTRIQVCDWPWDAGCIQQ